MELSLGNPTIYILHLVDGGIIRRTCARYELSELLPLVVEECSQFQLSFGITSHEMILSTEDAYAEIIRVDLNSVAGEETIWTYHFDGSQHIGESLKRIPLQTNPANPTIITKEKMRSIINVSLGRSIPLMGEIVMNMMDEISMPLPEDTNE